MGVRFGGRVEGPPVFCTALAVLKCRVSLSLVGCERYLGSPLSEVVVLITLVTCLCNSVYRNGTLKT